MTSAYGKAILAGEHAVVYGHPAVAVALERGVSCVAEPANASASRLVVPAWSVDARAGESSPLGRMLSQLQRDVAGGVALEYRVQADIPAGAGLGSSAALAIASIRATAAATNQSIDDARVVEIANQLELQFHQKASGIDVALCSGGGTLLFQRERPSRRLDGSWLSLVVADTGEPRSTRDMVRKVAELRPRADAELANMGMAARMAAEAVEAQDAVSLGHAMATCHGALSKLGLVTEGMQALCDVATEAGAVAAKMTGAGGGGAIIALAPGREEAVCAALRAAAKDVFVSRVAGEH